MAGRNPRLNVTVTPQQHELLLEIARLQGSSASKLIGELVARSEPLFRALLPVLKASETAQERFAAEVGKLSQAAVEHDGRQLDLEGFIHEMVTAAFGEGAQPSAAVTNTSLEDASR